MMTRMSGALVTGAGRGLGRAIATRLHARGLQVCVSDVDPELAAAVAAELGEPAWSLALDVTDAAACRAAAASVAARSGALAVWVNNAGILFTGHAWETTDAQRDALLAVNAGGLMNGTLAALELMRPVDRGDIVNVCSLAGIVAAPGETVYSATKHAAVGFTLGTLFDLRRSGTKHVNLGALCPDGIWTPMLHDRLEDPNAAVSFQGVLLDVDRVADAAVAMLDTPRPFVGVPRWRGAQLRVFAAFPRLGVAVLPLVLLDARRKQRRHARRLRAGA